VQLEVLLKPVAQSCNTRRSIRRTSIQLNLESVLFLLKAMLRNAAVSATALPAARSAHSGDGERPSPCQPKKLRHKRSRTHFEGKESEGFPQGEYDSSWLLGRGQQK
jgi:hypothetical protein